jgi:hypothetical protein
MNIEYQSMSIFKACKLAKEYNQRQKVSYAKREVDKLEVDKYTDFTVGDFL